jgi:putative oxidoreductase
MQRFIPLIGRILVAQIFFISGVSKIFDLSGTQQYMDSYGIPLTVLFLVSAIIIELGGSISVLLGYKARLGAGALLIFLIPVTIIFHTNFSERLQIIMFMKNLSIIGGLLMIIAYGPGEISLDRV